MIFVRRKCRLLPLTIRRPARFHDPPFDVGSHPIVKSSKSIKDQYQALLESGNLREDDAQLGVVQRLHNLQEQLVAGQTLLARVKRALPGRKRDSHVKGIYLWGGVGRGKTLLMDLFYQSLDIPSKRRIHCWR